MSDSKSSGTSRASENLPSLGVPSRSQKQLEPIDYWVAALVIFLCLVFLGLSWRQGWILYFGDAQAHVNIARRIVDSRTPGLEQVGTVWLPLPHLLMLPLVTNDVLWQTGLAGAIPATASFILGCLLFYAGLRRTFQSCLAALAGLSILVSNPNWLYLQTTPMTEPVFFFFLMGTFYTLVRYREHSSRLWALLCGLSLLGASLTRYEGWFLIPFALLVMAWFSGFRNLDHLLIAGVVASSGPLAWLAHNWWWYGDPLEFYRGPYSARGIYEKALAQGMQPYPGDHQLGLAFKYYLTAAQLVAGKLLFFLGFTGALAALLWRKWWPVILFIVVPVFYVISIYGAATPIFVPTLWPFSYYNTRYALSLTPLLAVGIAFLTALFAERWRRAVAVLVPGVVALAIFQIGLQPSGWLCWQEAEVNSRVRRQWTAEAARFLHQHYRPGQGILTRFGDLMGIFQQAGIPLRETLHDGNNPLWAAAVKRPDLFLWESWIVTTSDDRLAEVVHEARERGILYRCVKQITVKGGPVIEIFRRDYAHEAAIQESPRFDE